MDNSLFLADEEATLAFGRRLAIAAADGGIVYLHGDLGAGKTTLVRGLMRGHGFQGAVKSPTYTLVEPYELDQCHIYHFDLYRLADPGEVEYLGTEDYFKNNNLCLIEWPNRGGDAIPAADLSIELSSEGSGRRLHVASHSARGDVIAKRLRA